MEAEARRELGRQREIEAYSNETIVETRQTLAETVQEQPAASEPDAGGSTSGRPTNLDDLLNPDSSDGLPFLNRDPADKLKNFD